jgi:tetratricopeptide (TPR) repeat protein
MMRRSLLPVNPSSLEPSAVRSDRVALALVASAALLSFAPALRSGFALDDGAFLPPGPPVTSVRNPLVFFCGSVWDFANVHIPDVPLYRPGTTLALWALAPLLGAAPAAWHLPAVLLHVLATVLVYALARRLVGPSPVAPAAGALVFALHPVHVEAVAPALGFGHVLAAVLGLAALHAQVSHARSGHLRWLVVAAAASAAAMLTTEVAFAIPPLLVLVEWVERRARPASGVLAAAALPLALVFVLRGRAVSGALPLALEAPALGNAAAFAAAYARNLLVPWPQPLYLSLPAGGVAGPLDWTVAALAAAGAAWLVARAGRADRPVLLLALGIVALGAGPAVAAGLNPHPLFAPRALYLASAGLALLVAWGADRARAAAPRLAPGALALLAALGLAGCLAGTRGWRDELTVRKRVIASDPDFGPGHLALARAYATAGEDGSAEHHLSEAVRLARDPVQRADATEELGLRLGQAGRLDEAERLLRGVVADAPGRATGWNNLGNVLWLLGRLPEARDAYERALAIAPDSYEAAQNLARVRDALGAGAGR